MISQTTISVYKSHSKLLFGYSLELYTHTHAEREKTSCAVSDEILSVADIRRGLRNPPGSFLMVFTHTHILHMHTHS